jgi:hypothetical protein
VTQADQAAPVNTQFHLARPKAGITEMKSLKEGKDV